MLKDVAEWLRFKKDGRVLVVASHLTQFAVAGYGRIWKDVVPIQKTPEPN